MNKRTKTIHRKQKLLNKFSIVKKHRLIKAYDCEILTIHEAQIRGVIGSALGVPPHLLGKISINPIKAH